MQNGHSNGSDDEIAIEGFSNVTQQDAQEYLNNYKAHKRGITHSEMVKVYTQWAEKYDTDLCPGRYNGPEIAAEFMSKYYSENLRAGLKIIDVAAGTGRVGVKLYERGFRNMDALEPSEGMMQILKERNVYTGFYEHPIGYDTIEDIPSKHYDSLVIAGGMGEGHIPVIAIDEMLRYVKLGGIIVIVMREEYLTYVKEYVNKLEPYMKHLEEQGFWKLVSRNVVSNYSFRKNGIVFVFEVTSEKWPTNKNDSSHFLVEKEEEI